IQLASNKSSHRTPNHPNRNRNQRRRKPNRQRDTSANQYPREQIPAKRICPEKMALIRQPVGCVSFTKFVAAFNPFHDCLAFSTAPLKKFVFKARERQIAFPWSSNFPELCF